MNLRLTHLCPFTLLTAVVVASNSAVNGTTPNRASFGAAWQTVDCKTFDVPAAVTAQSDCGYVTVPEQHGQTQGRTIQLGVVRTRSTGKTPAADPLFVEQGGPGGTTIGVFANVALPEFPELKALLERRDLIFMEERGTRYAKPFLFCPEFNAHTIAVAQGQQNYTDPGWIKACHDRFKTQGVNLNAFNTRENAADVYFVAETLGYRQFNFYGVSYGTLLGQYVIAQADKHKAKLRSVIMDGVVRPDVDFNLASSHTISYALRNLFHACAQDQKCSQAYPGLEQKFLTIVDQLNQKPIPITLTIPSSKKAIAAKLDGSTFVDGIMPYLYTTPHGGDLPKQIFAASQGNFDWITKRLSNSLKSDSAKEMYHTVLCVRAKSIQVTPSQVLPPPYPQLLPIGVRESEAVTKACDILQVEQKLPFVYENPEIPTLVFNGAYDPMTPQPYGEAVAKNLKTTYVYTFPGVGHGALILPPDLPAAACSTQIAADFLANPKQTPDSRCLTQIKPAFVVE
ncbi:alpha/beta hydrolase [Leptolyngbyaceae cyanobacterium UHCC 1019]